MMTGGGSVSWSGRLRRCGAYATGFPDCETHSVLSRTSWMAMAPGTVLMVTVGGSVRNGTFSLKPHAGGANGSAFGSARNLEARAMPNNTRHEGLSRAISMMGPTGTFATPARIESYRASHLPP